MLYDPNWSAEQDERARLATIYKSAADVIEERGHSIGMLKDQSGRMCLWGAISFVVDGNALSARPETREMVMTKAIQALRPFTRGAHPIMWNNRPTRTKTQVINLLRRAAKAMSAPR